MAGSRSCSSSEYKHMNRVAGKVFRVNAFAEAFKSTLRRPLLLLLMLVSVEMLLLLSLSGVGC